MSYGPVIEQKPGTMVATTVVNGNLSPNLLHTKSGPSTPSQRPQSQMSERRSPITDAATREGSPRSQHSESGQTPNLSRRPHRGCRFETGMAQARRRVPYSLGPEPLASEPEQAAKTLSPEDAQSLTTQMETLYCQLLPSQESEDRRGRFVGKLDGLLRSRWPDAAIKVSVFGSTGNLLGTTDSDVDICITTDCKEIENVCRIAELLAQNGMQRIVCVSSAKVPIVKAWDPELQVACDMNVNNPIALENTEMIRSYIQLNERVRPLAMIVKHWAKRRILNDAALGGTLSSYTWICLVLNFLQTRNPPILPTLQQKEDLEPVVLGGVNVAFDKNLTPYNAFGAANTSLLGDLLFQFFRYYGHEFDFEENAISVRLGKVIPKSRKAWHLLQDNRLCVEEPFNTTRNLANTADDTSMRGIHLELRRAFQMLIDGDLTTCCEEYVRGPDEPKQTATFIQQTARPIIPQAPTQSTTSSTRSSRNGYRSSRNNNRNSAARRASNPASRNPNYLHDLPFQMTPQELQLQAQHQQHLLHDQLFQQYQYLQLQEQELRMQLYQQNLRQRGMAANQNFASPVLSSDGGMRLPISPNMFSGRVNATAPFLATPSPTNGVMTNPASPSLGHLVLDNRRFTRRTSVATSAPGGSTRAQSQPARSVPGSSVFPRRRPHYDMLSESGDAADRRSSMASHASTANLPFVPHFGLSSTLYEAGRRPAEFMGYYVGHSPSLMAHPQSSTISPIPSHAGLAIHNGGLSPKMSSHGSRVVSGASSPMFLDASLDVHSPRPDATTESRYPPSPPLGEGPLIIDGSLKSPKRRQRDSRSVPNSDDYAASVAVSDDNGIDTPATSEEHFQDSSDKLGAAINGVFQDYNIDSVLNQFQSFSTHSHQPKESLHSDVSSNLSGQLQDNESLSQMSTPTAMLSPNHSAGFLSENGHQTVKARRKKGTAERSPLNGYTETFSTLPLNNKTNGQHRLPSDAAPALFTDVANGWQTQKKKKKGRKAIKSEADLPAINSAGGDLLPLDESLRKGG